MGASGARLRFGDGAAAITAAAGLRRLGPTVPIFRCGAGVAALLAVVITGMLAACTGRERRPHGPAARAGEGGRQPGHVRPGRVRRPGRGARDARFRQGPVRARPRLRFPDLVPVAGRLSAGLGVDPRSFATAIAVGQAPDSAGLLLGEYDSAGAAKRLGDPAVAGDLAGVPALARIGAGGGAFAYASSQEGLAAVERPGERTLAANEVLAPLADCLGEASWRC